MVSSFIGLLDIQSWWEIPCIAHFCSLFSSTFDLPDFDIEDLESALLTDDTDDTVGLLPQLIVGLLKGCDVLRRQRNEITTSNYQMFLRRFLRHQCRQYNTENYFDSDIDFQSLPIRNKLLILYSLCHFRLDSDNVQDKLNNIEADSLRVKPLGYDSKNSGYWYFYGTRLYREDIKLKCKTTIWQIVCFTEEDWQNLTAKFKNSTSPKERALYNVLKGNFLPKLPQLFRESEKLRRKKLLQIRNSVHKRTIVEDRPNDDKQRIGLLERQNIDEQLKPESVNKIKNQSKLRSSSSSTASGISTYASSVRCESVNSSEFLYNREKFCLSPDLEDTQSSSKIENHNKYSIEICPNQQLIKIPKDINCENETNTLNTLNQEKQSNKNCLGFLKQEDKENCCQPSDVSETEVSCAESQASSEKFEMAPTTNIKLPGRQTNNSLSTITGNIFLSNAFNNTTGTATDNITKEKVTKEKAGASSSVSSGDNSNRKKKPKNIEISKRCNSPPKTNFLSFTETDEILQIGMHKVLLYVKNHRDAWPFMDPVEEDIAPRYYSIIRRPMDLLKMEEKLDTGKYTKFSEFRNDFKLIVNNCRLYNGQNNEYTEMVNNLQEAFDKATKKYFDHISSEEEGSVNYPDTKTNVFREKHFNKVNTNKTIPNEIVNKKEKEKHEKFHEIHEKIKESEVIEGSRANKRKSKDKDKRRKKKARGKSTTVLSDDDDNDDDKDDVYDDDEDNDDSSDDRQKIEDTKFRDNANDESSQDDTKKNKRKLISGKKISEHRKRKETSEEDQALSVLHNKKSRRKNDDVKVEVLEDISKTKAGYIKKIDEKPGNKKHCKSHKSLKRSKRSSTYSDNEGDISSFEEEEIKSDMESISETTTASNVVQEKSKRKHSSNQSTSFSTSKSSSSNSDRSKSTKALQVKSKQENEGQVAKTKSKKNNSGVSTNVTSEVEKMKNSHKDINKNTKKKGKYKKRNDSENESLRKNDGEHSVELKGRYDSLSRSSSPIYIVDLHKKYAKSASNETEDEFDSNKNKFTSKDKVSNKKLTKKSDVDLMSISSRSLSRSPSPCSSVETEGFNGGKTKRKLSNSSKGRKKVESNHDKPTTSSTITQETELSLPPFMDKYDLIKQRRSRNTDEKWNQIVKEAEKIKDNKKNTMAKPHQSTPSKEKNQKLRETIEKLKAKNAKSKERSVLIDEIFAGKTKNDTRNEKTIFQKLKDTCSDASPPEKKVDTPKKENEFDFPSTSSIVHTKTKKKESTSTDQKKVRNSSPKKPSKKNAGGNSATVVSNKTNMEALELETEQTLKDINRWLEHTPRFPEFSSASNSPSRYNLLDDFDAVASKLDPNDFRRTNQIASSKIDAVPKISDALEVISESKPDVIPDLIPIAPSSAISCESASVSNVADNATISPQTKPKDGNSLSTTQLIPHPPPPPPQVKSQMQKEIKRKSLKEKLASNNRRKELLRTIDRLQPGKTKGNLIGNIHNTNKPDEIFPIGSTSKTKEVKNSLVVQTDETTPKLSLGSVLNTEGFGLGVLHSFGDDIPGENSKINDTLIPSSESVSDSKNETSPISDTLVKSEENVTKKDEPETKVEGKIEKSSATPNLSAWFKAFGAPKKAKKTEEEDKKLESLDNVQATQQDAHEKSLQLSDQSTPKTSFNTLKSPTTCENFPLPAPRQRKASTGSTISERSSFSQDPDSPRVGIDDRFGGFSGPYASPIGASPIMVSPKPEELGKPTSPYPLNGAIKVGFYQDTTTKSSPEKSCSPRELPSPYPQYSQHIYSAASPNVNSDLSGAFGNCYNSTADQQKAPVFSNTSPSPIFEQYKQPHSQESEYNSSMSPSTNPNSPYQQPQNSPYQQHQTSPYQQAQNSPYQQPQNSPFQNQSGTTQNIITQSPNHQSSGVPPPPQLQCDQSRGPNSPYQQSANSPYQQHSNSPYNQQNPASPYQQNQNSQQQAPINYVQQRNTSVPNMENAQVPADHRPPPYSQDNPQYALHESTPQFPQQTQSQQLTFEQEIPKSPAGMMNKMQTTSEWSNQIDVGNQPRQPTNLTSMNHHVNNQLHTPPLQAVQPDEISSVHNIQQEGNKDNVQYQRNVQYQYGTTNKNSPKPPQQPLYSNEIPLDVIQQRQMPIQEQILKNSQTNIVKNSQQPESGMVNLCYPEQAKVQKHEIEKQFDSTLKHQQMFDSFLGSMAASKSLSFAKPIDISTSKAFEMFNRAATMGFPKDFPNTLVGVNKPESITSLPNDNSTTQNQQYHVVGSKLMTNSQNAAVPNNKNVGIVNNNYDQQHQMQITQAENVDNKIHQQQNASMFVQKLPQQHQTNSYPTNLVQPPVDKVGNELVIPNPRQDQMSNISRNQHMNMDLSNYKTTFSNPSAMLDPLRNLNHPLAMVDENMLGLQNPSPSGFYDKNIPPAHIFTKNLGQQVYQNPSPYGSREQQNPGAYISPVPATSQPLEGIEQKVSKRSKKKKNATPSPAELSGGNPVQNAMHTAVPQQLPPLQGQSIVNNQQNPQSSQNPQQGFQLYAGLKTAATSVAPNSDSSAIALKSATSMVPGSAFNFGPSPTGLSLPTGIYGDNSGYLEDFRGAPNPYYIPSGHRSTPDSKPDVSTNPGATPPTYHQFLTHTSSRGSYSFMNSQLDPNSPIYQQYLQRQEELRARMMLNQGLLGPGAAPGYPHPQTGYRPALGMPKPYDMNRQPWF